MTKGTHRITIEEQGKDIRWDSVKDSMLKASRGVGFEQAAALIETGDVLAVEDHMNPARYPNQRVCNSAAN